MDTIFSNVNKHNNYLYSLQMTNFLHNFQLGNTKTKRNKVMNEI